METAVNSAQNAAAAQVLVDGAQAKVTAVTDLKADYNTSAWDSVISAQKAVVNQLKANEDAVAADPVIAMVTALPKAVDVKLSHKGAIEAARDAYNKLSEAQKELVDLVKLAAAENALEIEIEKNTVFYKMASQDQQYTYIRFSKEHAVKGYPKYKTIKGKSMEVSQPFTTGKNSPNHLMFKYDSNVASSDDSVKIIIPFKDGTQVEVVLTFNNETKVWEIEGEFLEKE